MRAWRLGREAPPLVALAVGTNFAQVAVAQAAVGWAVPAIGLRVAAAIRVPDRRSDKCRRDFLRLARSRSERPEPARPPDLDQTETVGAARLPGRRQTGERCSSLHPCMVGSGTFETTLPQPIAVGADSFVRWPSEAVG